MCQIGNLLSDIVKCIIIIIIINIVIIISFMHYFKLLLLGISSADYSITITARLVHDRNDFTDESKISIWCLHRQWAMVMRGYFASYI